MEFPLPEFLSELSVEALHRSMLDQLPEDIDRGEGGPVWDLTRPAAYITAEMAQYVLPWFLSQIWAQSASGKYLDMHAQRRALYRREAVPAQGLLALAGKPGTLVPAGSVFSTAGKSGVEAVEFETLEEALLGEAPAEVPVRAVKPGRDGNVAANTILLPVSQGLTGVTSAANLGPTTGGYDREDDESLRERVLEYDRSPGSYIGSAADYRRWAMSVTGVGGVVVSSPTDGSGVVTLILTDQSGAPAPAQLCQAVYDYIMTGANPAQQRLAPVNAQLVVCPPEVLSVTIAALVELEPGAGLDAVKEAFSARLTAYFHTAREEGELRFTQIAALLAAVPGIHDYKGLALNGGQENVPLPQDQAPALEGLSLTEGVV